MCCKANFETFFSDFNPSAEVSEEVAHATFHGTSIQEPISLLVILSLIALKTIAIRDEIINIEIGLLWIDERCQNYLKISKT